MSGEKILIAGAWKLENPERFRAEGERLGELLAQGGFSLILGPASGISSHVEKGFSRVAQHGEVIYYKPSEAVMALVGEELKIQPDRIVRTETDYPRRNLRQIEAADAMLVITGRAGTVTEVINAVLDYDKPVAILEGSGEVVDIIKGTSGIREKVFFGRTPEELVAYINNKLFGKDSLEGNILVST